MPTTTPSEITTEISDFVKSFTANAPEYVAVTNTLTPLECFTNVSNTIAANGGGKMVLGWAVWQRAGAYVEAEHHAVYERVDGTLLDVTPHDGETHILFARDEAATFNGKIARNNHRLALTDDPNVVEFLKIGDRSYQINRKLQLYGPSKIGKSDFRDMKAGLPRMQKLLAYIDETYAGEQVYSRR